MPEDGRRGYVRCPAHQRRSWIPAGTRCVATALISRETSVTIRRVRQCLASAGALLVATAVLGVSQHGAAAVASPADQAAAPLGTSTATLVRKTLLSQLRPPVR